jgi:hypothetical protein
MPPGDAAFLLLITIRKMMLLLGEEYFQLIFSVKNSSFSSKTWLKPGVK